MTIGIRIKKQRKALKLTLADLSKRTKLSTGNLSELENDKYAPSVASLLLLSQVLNCSIDWLVTGEDTTIGLTEKHKTDEIQNSSNVRFSDIETDIILMFRELDERDQEDTFDSIKLKYDRMLKKGKQTSLYSTYTEEKESKKDNESDTSNNNSDIA